MPLVQIPSELKELRNTLRDFIAREVRPVEESYGRELQEGNYAPLKGERSKIRKRSAELGFWTIHMPEAVGGMGLSYLGRCSSSRRRPARG